MMYSFYYFLFVIISFKRERSNYLQKTCFGLLNLLVIGRTEGVAMLLLLALDGHLLSKKKKKEWGWGRVQVELRE